MKVTSRRDFLRNLTLTATALFTGSLLSSTKAQSGKNRLNVLMIPVDDLRPQLGCYGFDRIISHINHDVIHGDSADHRVPFPLNQHLSRIC